MHRLGPDARPVNRLAGGTAVVDSHRERPRELCQRVVAPFLSVAPGHATGPILEPRGLTGAPLDAASVSAARAAIGTRATMNAPERRHRPQSINHTRARHVLVSVRRRLTLSLGMIILLSPGSRDNNVRQPPPPRRDAH